MFTFYKGFSVRVTGKESVRDDVRMVLNDRSYCEYIRSRDGLCVSQERVGCDLAGVTRVEHRDKLHFESLLIVMVETRMILERWLVGFYTS